MKNSITFLIVDNNQSKNFEKQQIIKGDNLSNEVKIAMNAGHALLYLDHIHLDKKINDNFLAIILHMNTPISDGYEFLSAYHRETKLKKERIHIIVVDENLSEEKQEKIRELGVDDFISESFPIEDLREIIERRFSTPVEINHNTSHVKREKSYTKSKVSSIICN